jgi:hypothetical protein
MVFIFVLIGFFVYAFFGVVCAFITCRKGNDGMEAFLFWPIFLAYAVVSFGVKCLYKIFDKLGITHSKFDL